MPITGYTIRTKGTVIMYELRVLTGLHRGAALPLAGEQWTLGADEDTDLVLFDPGIKPRHCHLERQEEGWVLTAMQGKITDAEGHRLDALPALRPNMAFSLNGIWMTIVEANTPWPNDDEEVTAAPSPAPATPPAARRSGVPFFLGFLSAAAIVATSAWATLTPEPTPAPALVSAPEAEPSKPVLSGATDVERQLRRMLVDRELGNKVHIEASDQHIVLNGSLSLDERELVNRMLTRFQQRFSTPLSIDNQISALSLSLPFEIVQITSGPMGSVVTGDGRRLFIGDELDGVRLVSIDSDKVLFQGDQDFEVIW